MQITPEQWPVLSQLLDEGLELPLDARERWLASLDGPHAALRDQLAVLLNHYALIETAHFLETMPKIDAAEGVCDGASSIPGLAPGSVIGQYVLEEEVGRGGMGVVWRARRADGLLKPRRPQTAACRIL
jgi:eukaryotic-like serine/threonine-protein kinase